MGGPAATFDPFGLHPAATPEAHPQSAPPSRLRRVNVSDGNRHSVERSGSSSGLGRDSGSGSGGRGRHSPGRRNRHGRGPVPARSSPPPQQRKEGKRRGRSSPLANPPSPSRATAPATTDFERHSSGATDSTAATSLDTPSSPAGRQRQPVHSHAPSGLASGRGGGGGGVGRTSSASRKTHKSDEDKDELLALARSNLPAAPASRFTRRSKSSGDRDEFGIGSRRGHQSSMLDYHREMEQLHGPPRRSKDMLYDRGHQSMTLDYRHEPEDLLRGKRHGRGKRVKGRENRGGGDDDLGFRGHESATFDFKSMLGNLPDELPRSRSGGSKSKSRRGGGGEIVLGGHKNVALEIDGLPDEDPRSSKGSKGKGGGNDPTFGGFESMAMELENLPDEVPRNRSRDRKSRAGDGDLGFGGHENMALGLDDLPFDEPPLSRSKGRRGDKDPGFDGHESITLKLDSLPDELPRNRIRGNKGKDSGDDTGFDGGKSMSMELDDLPDEPHRSRSRSQKNRGRGTKTGGGGNGSVALELDNLPDELPPNRRRRSKDREKKGFGRHENIALMLDDLPDELPCSHGRGSNERDGGQSIALELDNLPDELPGMCSRGNKDRIRGEDPGFSRRAGIGLELDDLPQDCKKRGDGNESIALELDNLPDEFPRGRGRDHNNRDGGHESLVLELDALPDEIPRSCSRDGQGRSGGDGTRLGGHEGLALELDNLPDELPRSRNKGSKGRHGGNDLGFSGHEGLALELDNLPDELPQRRGEVRGGENDPGFDGNESISLDFGGELAGLPDEAPRSRGRGDKGQGNGDGPAFSGHERMALDFGDEFATLRRRGTGENRQGHQSSVPDYHHDASRDRRRRHISATVGEVAWNNVRASAPVGDAPGTRRSLQTASREDVLQFEPDGDGGIDDEEHELGMQPKNSLDRDSRNAAMRRQGSGSRPADDVEKKLAHQGPSHRQDSTGWLKNSAHEDHRRAMSKKGDSSRVEKKVEKVVKEKSKRRKESGRHPEKDNARYSRSASHSSVMTPNPSSASVVSQQRRASAAAPLPDHYKRAPILYSLAQSYRWDKVEARIQTHPEEIPYFCPFEGTTTLHLACMSWAGYDLHSLHQSSGVEDDKPGISKGKSSSNIRQAIKGLALQRKMRSSQSMFSSKNASKLSFCSSGSHNEEDFTGALASLDVIQALVDACPDACVMKCRKNSYTPLAYACLVPPIPKKKRRSKATVATDNDDERSLDEEELRSSQPEEDEDEPFTAADLTLDDREDLVRLLLDAHRDAASVLTRNGMSPLDLHIVSYSKTRGRACADGEGIDGKTTTGVLRALLDADPVMARAGRPFTLSGEDDEEEKRDSNEPGEDNQKPRERKCTCRGGSRPDAPISPLELLYRNNAPAFLTMLAREDEIHNRRNALTRQQSAKQPSNSCTSSIFFPPTSESVKSTLSEWWVWKWTVLLLKYGTMTKERRGTFFKAVHAAASVVGCPLPLLMLTVRAFPKQIREVSDAEKGNMALHIVCSWGKDKVAFGDAASAGAGKVGDGAITASAAKTSANADSVETSRRGMVICALLGEYAKAAGMPNSEGRYPLSLALATGGTWDSGVRRLVQAYPDALRIRDKPTGMFPFMIAAVGEQIQDKQAEDDVVGGTKDKQQGRKGTTDSFKARRRRVLNELRTVYELLRHDPRVMENFVPRERNSRRSRLTRGGRGGQSLGKMPSAGLGRGGRRGMRKLDALN